MTIEYRSFSFTPAAGTETRSADATGDKLAGHAIVYNRDSHDLGGFVEIVAPGALTRSLKQASAGELNVHALWSHDSSQPLGSTRGGKLALSSDDEGLAFELDTSRFTPAQLDAARDGDLQMSFGFRVVKDSWVRRDDGVAERTLIDVDLFEVSPVISPAYPDTTAALRSLEAWKADEVRSTDLATLYGEVSDSEAIILNRQSSAIKIKRELTKKALEQHIRGLSASK